MMYIWVRPAGPSSVHRIGCCRGASKARPVRVCYVSRRMGRKDARWLHLPRILR